MIPTSESERMLLFCLVFFFPELVVVTLWEGGQDIFGRDWWHIFGRKQGEVFRTAVPTNYDKQLADYQACGSRYRMYLLPLWAGGNGMQDTRCPDY